eukprot:358595-Chlamydomonas_euryale.AAC.2
MYSVLTGRFQKAKIKRLNLAAHPLLLARRSKPVDDQSSSYGATTWPLVRRPARACDAVAQVVDKEPLGGRAVADFGEENLGGQLDERALVTP